MSLSQSQRTGAIVSVVFALISALTLTFALLRTIRFVTKLFLKRNDTTSSTPDILFFRTRLGHYAGCLIFSNFCISVARLIDLDWVLRSGPVGGSTCAAQVVLMQVGIWSISWFTASHSVHTLCSLVFHIPQARWTTIVNIVIGWTSAFIVAFAPLRQDGVYGPVGLSCTITESHPIEKFSLQIFPVILGAIVSTTVYSIVFIVVHRKLCVNTIQKLRRSNSTASQRTENNFDEYHRFITMIIRTMFWFPLAFVILFLPFCIAHLLLVAGQSVPTAACVFADVCVSMLGFVNVGLLCNTFRVIRRVYDGSRGIKVAVETVKTFGNDASNESPIVPSPSQLRITSYGSSHRTNDLQLERPRSNHYSWSSVDSNSELLAVENASYESIQSRVPSLPPPVLSRQLCGAPGVVLPLNITKKQHVKFQPEITIDSQSHATILNHHCSYTPSVTEESSIQDEEYLTGDTVVSEARAKRAAFKSKAPPALGLSYIYPELPSVPRQVPTKSAALSAQASIPAVSASALTSQIVAYSAQKCDKGKARAPATLIPRRMEKADSKSSLVSSPPFTSDGSDSDSDSDCSVEIMHVRKVRPLPQIPEPSPSKEEDTPASHVDVLQEVDNRSYRMTTTTVWSQETGYTLGRSLEMESREASPRPVADVFVPRAMTGDRADVGAVPVISKNAPRVPPKPLLLSARVGSLVGSKLSASLSGMLSPRTPIYRFSPPPGGSIV